MKTGLDHRIIMEFIDDGSTVLDLGCGTGELLCLLAEEKDVKGQGIEIDDKAIFECVAKGLNVFHDDIDTGLPEYGDKSFDYVVLNQSLQQVKKPDHVLREAIRVGRKVIVGIPNFAYIKARLQIGFLGRVPVTPSLPYQWYDTPNLHFLSLLDFIEYCHKKGFVIEKSRYIGKKREVHILPNLFALTGVFLLAGEVKG
ncbi:MAG: methionine biosynthesis protein MetW [Syntrophorhabdaceae bacterium]|nr:methionine biosynthesis protein MetW [Syntrophorhabdaceae bacterium]